MSAQQRGDADRHVEERNDDNGARGGHASHHDYRYPQDSDGYREARNALLAAEIELRAQIESVAELRRTLLLDGEVLEDYVFTEVDGDAVREVHLSELFEDGKDSLIIYSFMLGPAWDAPCPCARRSWTA